MKAICTFSRIANITSCTWTKCEKTSYNILEILSVRRRNPTTQSSRKCAKFCSETTKSKKLHIKLKKEDIMTIPNVLSMGRIISTPFLGYLIVNCQYEYAVSLLVVAGITDALDGWIARNFPSQASVLGSALDPLATLFFENLDGWIARNFPSQASVLGSALDPLADKLLVGTLVISLFLNGDLPAFLTYLILGRDTLLMAAGFVLRYKSLEPPITLARYFDLGKPSVQLAPTVISKVNTALQLGTLALTLSGGLWSPVKPYLPYAWYATAGTTIASALSYVFQKNTYKYMSKK
ncbi:probable cardiolipin synthase (CMP-forming) isoform X2 [Artemia franciscana]|uniref:probable cardiolipin synthase (CMP-forming) isoform X2 n=1 Tax=Artemia franciscana TaxID=6661 RepID=UPI0032DBCD0C